MVKKQIYKANIVVCAVVTVGIVIACILNYHVNSVLINNYCEKITALTSESVYNKIQSDFSTPIEVSRAIANDKFLIDWLEHESENLDNEAYTKEISEYLSRYMKSYKYETIFLASTNTQRFYTNAGFNRIIDDSKEDEIWFKDFLSSNKEYNINIDTDKAENNEVTFFVNCRIVANDKVVGVVGFGFRAADFQSLLKQYEKDYDVYCYLIDDEGKITISSDYTKFNENDFFEIEQYKKYREQILSTDESKNFWMEPNKNYISTKYIPYLSSHFIIDHDTSTFNTIMHQQYYQIAVGGLIILAILLITTTIITKKYNNKLIDLVVSREKERKNAFRTATEQLYDNIYEMNITKNSAAGKRTNQYFESLGVPKEASFDDALETIAKKQIKEEFREDYISTFNSKNVLKIYDEGINHLSYEFQISLDGLKYVWIRIDAHIFLSAEDNCIHMFTYSKNIDAEKNEALKISMKAELDEMTMLYNKTTTQHLIEKELAENPDKIHAFFILDIDKFKQVNDEFGHAFGDAVIIEFASILKQNFRHGDIVGRFGGDEFVVFVTAPGAEWAKIKAESLSEKLNTEFTKDSTVCNFSASIGVTTSPEHGTTFEELFKNADIALYQTKKNGRNGYIMYKDFSSLY